jgi:hypothetical protein
VHDVFSPRNRHQFRQDIRWIRQRRTIDLEIYPRAGRVHHARRPRTRLVPDVAATKVNVNRQRAQAASRWRHPIHFRACDPRREKENGEYLETHAHR